MQANPFKEVVARLPMAAGDDLATPLYDSTQLLRSQFDTEGPRIRCLSRLNIIADDVNSQFKLVSAQTHLAAISRNSPPIT